MTTKKPADSQQRPEQNTGYMLEELDGELLLYHLDQTTTVYLNNSAAIVWHLCDGTRTIADIITVLQAKFPNAADDITADVKDAVEQLQQAGALSLK